MRVLFSILLLVLSAPGFLAHAAEPLLEISIMPPEVPYQRSAIYVLHAIGSATFSCEFPDLPSDSKVLEVRRLAGENELMENKERHITQKYVLDPIFPGRYLLPSITISWKDGDAEGTMVVPPLVFAARELSDAEQEAVAKLAAITAPSALLPQKRFSPFLVLIFVAVLVLATAAAVALWRHFNLRRAYEAPPVPAWTAALHRLRELQQRDLPGAGRIDAYYVDLSSILRYYIEDRFFIHAPEQTTPEVLDAAARHGVFSSEQQQFLAEFLHQCDRVKFARLQPGLDEINNHFKAVKHFIQSTIPDDISPDAMEQAA